MKIVRIAAALLAVCSIVFSADPGPGAPSAYLGDSQNSAYTVPNRVSVHVLGLFHPSELMVNAEANHPLSVVAARHRVAIGDSLCPHATLNRLGDEVSLRCGELRIAAAQIDFFAKGGNSRFVLSVPGKLRREYRGRLTVSARKNELIAVVEMDLETAVASVVAAELPADTPFEALKAQAVVSRSFLAASQPRHTQAEFCDTTHCEFLRSPPSPTSPAARATEATKGMLLTWNGKPFPAMYSASCGGSTRTLEQAGYRQRDYPYFAVECTYCLRHPEQSGNGGHGIGLCQKGAAGMARDGADFRSILAHYFPNTEVRAVNSEQALPQDSF